jgi:hypothetical protein
MEIARSEGLRLEFEISEAVGLDPTFLLYVVSPQALSEQSLTELGVSMAENGAPLSVGVLTGSTFESARMLYSRSFAYTRGHAVIDDPQAAIRRFSGDSTVVVSLDSTNLLETLKSTSYLCYSGHGGGGYWRLSDELVLTARDLEPLQPVLVSSGACQTFRPWEEHSIALAFTDMGAAAYAGFLFSPAPYYHFGFPHGFPLLYTYPEYPIGMVIALQNRGSLRSFARFPFYFLLGDPRKYFSREKPWRLIEDHRSESERVIRYECPVNGFIPVKIEEGAGYPFMEISGVGSAGVRDLYYNGKMQFLDHGGNRYLLFDHPGGDFTIRLMSEEPLLRPLRDMVIDALDHALVYIPAMSGIIFLLIVAASVLFVTVVYAVRSGGRMRGFYVALAAGICIASWRGLYALMRVGRASIVSIPLSIELRFIIATFLLAGCGAFLYLNVRSRFWRIGTLFVMTFPTWVVALFWGAGITYVNLFGAVPHIGTPIYSYNLAVMPALAFAVECIAIIILMRVLSSRSRARS